MIYIDGNQTELNAPVSSPVFVQDSNFKDSNFKDSRGYCKCLKFPKSACVSFSKTTKLQVCGCSYLAQLPFLDTRARFSQGLTVLGFVSIRGSAEDSADQTVETPGFRTTTIGLALSSPTIVTHDRWLTGHSKEERKTALYSPEQPWKRHQ